MLERMDTLIEIPIVVGSCLLWMLLVASVQWLASEIGACRNCGRPRRRRVLLHDVAGDDYRRILDSAVEHGISEELVEGLRQEVDAVAWQRLRLYAVECRRCRLHWLQAGIEKVGVTLIPWPDERRRSPRATTSKQIEILRWTIEADYLERRIASHRRRRPWTAADIAAAKRAMSDLRAASGVEATRVRVAEQQSREPAEDGHPAEWGCVVYEDERQLRRGTNQQH